MYLSASQTLTGEADKGEEAKSSESGLWEAEGLGQSGSG